MLYKKLKIRADFELKSGVNKVYLKIDRTSYRARDRIFIQECRQGIGNYILIKGVTRMYKVEIDDYIRVVDSKGNEVLHIELDANMDDVTDELNRLIDSINNKIY